MYATITDWQTETPATPENLTYSITASWMISGLIFEVAAGNMFRHGWVANCQASFRQGNLI